MSCQPSTESCPTCKGTGQEHHGIQCTGSHPHRTYTPITSPCWTCNSTGRIPVQDWVTDLLEALHA